MLFNRLFRSRTTRRPVKPLFMPARRNAARLRLEALDDRVVPAFLDAVNYAAGSGPEPVAIGDFNNDRVLDLAVAAGGEAVSVLLGNADGTFQPAISSPAGHSPRSLAVGDFNADGKLDLVTGEGGWINVDFYTEVTVLLGHGDGTFQISATIDTSYWSYDCGAASVSVGDFNADGKLDIATVNSNDFSNYPDPGGGVECYAAVVLGTGTGTFGEPIWSHLGYGYHSSAAVADFNFDGKLDIVAVSDDGYMYFAPGSGTGTFGGLGSIYVGSDRDAFIAAADVNNDGKVDLVMANYNSDTVTVLLLDVSGPLSYATGSSPTSLAVADFNADGIIDLVTANASSASVSVLLGVGAGAFLPPVIAAVGTYPLGVAVGDFNGDGRMDAAVTNYGDDSVSVLLNDGIWPALNSPSLAVNDVTVTEGNSGTVNATFTVSLSAASSQTVTVHYATADGSAKVAGGDYLAASGTLTFAPGETTKTITVLVNGDRQYEDSEFFDVLLSNPANAFVANDRGVGTIVNDEPYVYLTGDVSRAEGDTGTTPFTFTAALSAAYDAPLTVAYASADGTATAAGGDYQAASGTLTFAPGETTKNFTVLVNGDRVGEPDEFFSVSLGDPSNVAFSSSPARGTIRDDEPAVRISDASGVEGNSGTTPLTFTVTLSAADDAPVTVYWATADGGATVAGGDYQAASGTLTFAPGETTKTITVLVNGDRLGEPTTWYFYDEAFNVNLSQAVGAVIADSQGVGTIRDDEPRMSINDARGNEGNSGTTAVTFTVGFWAAYDLPVTVNFATHDGIATPGGDYQPTSGMLTFAPGETGKTISVPVNGDRLSEGNETFFVSLSNLNYGYIADNLGQGTIVDDEPQMSISDVAQTEGKRLQTTLFTFTVTLSVAYDQPVTVSFRTADGTAKAGEDYVAKSGTLTFAPGETTKTITIAVTGDNKRESNETFFLDLFGNSSNSLVTKSRGLGIIQNDDGN